MIGDFSFNGQHLSDLGAVITDRIQYPISEREMELIPIPGKSGDVILDKKRFKNIPLAYKISHVPTFSDDPGRHFAFRLSEWLTSSYEYGILRESYTPGYFYKAVCKGISTAVEDATGCVTATVSFSCDPYLYADSGAVEKSYSSTAVQDAENESHQFEIETYIFNPEKWESEPLITITGSGKYSAAFGSDVVNINDDSGTIIIDKPHENVYDENGNPKNNKLSAQNLPVFAPGNNLVRVWSDNPVTVKIKPNWRRR